MISSVRFDCFRYFVSTVTKYLLRSSFRFAALTKRSRGTPSRRRHSKGERDRMKRAEGREEELPRGFFSFHRDQLPATATIGAIDRRGLLFHVSHETLRSRAFA